MYIVVNVITTMHMQHHSLPTQCHALLQVERLPVFWKQQRLMFFDAFSFAFPAALQRIPYSVLVSLIWTVVTYWAVGLAGQPSRCSLFLIAFCSFPFRSLLPFVALCFRSLVLPVPFVSMSCLSLVPFPFPALLLPFRCLSLCFPLLLPFPCVHFSLVFPWLVDLELLLCPLFTVPPVVSCVVSLLYLLCCAALCCAD